MTNGTGQSKKDHTTGYQFTIAIILISAYIFTFSMAAFAIQSGDTVSIVISAFGNIVAAIVGFYFGQRPTQEARAEARQSKGAVKEGDKLKEKADDVIRALEEKVPAGAMTSDLKEQIKEFDNLQASFDQKMRDLLD